MSKVIAIVNEKGGVGKTTTATNLAYLIGKQNKRVLLIDFDGQANATILIGNKNPNQITTTISTILNNIIDKNYIIEKEEVIIKNKGIDLIPSNANLFSLESKLTTIPFREYILKKLIDNIKGYYDYIIIDCMPQIGTPMINVMIASDSLIIPTQSEILSVKGLTELIRHYLMIKRVNEKLKIDGILITMDSKNTKTSKEVKKLLNSSFKENINIFNTVIPNSIKVAEANVYKQIICEYLPTNKVCKAYENLLKELIEIG
ncbi:MAG: ParA family protein [Clostridiales bacterium]|nr:ParA family protein [Clostridiales bacterium]